MSDAETTVSCGQCLSRDRERFFLGYEERDCGYETPCWAWLRHCDKYGYGRFKVDGKHGLAHRWAYRQFVGPIPEGLHVHHRCNNRACVNPAHLEPVTCRENLMLGDTYAARAVAQTHCIHGHEFTPDNTYRHGNGSRHCRECQRRRKREHDARQRAAA